MDANCVAFAYRIVLGFLRAISNSGPLTQPPFIDSCLAHTAPPPRKAITKVSTAVKSIYYEELRLRDINYLKKKLLTRNGRFYRHKPHTEVYRSSHDVRII